MATALEQVTLELKAFKEETGTLVKTLEAKNLATVSQTKALEDQNKVLTEQLARFNTFLAQPNINAQALFAQPIDHKEEGKWGYKSFGEYLVQVKTAGRDPNVFAQLEQRIGKGLERTKSMGGIMAKAALGLDVAVDSEGGFLAPPTFSSTVFERVYENDEIIKRCDNYTVTGNEMVFPAIDETSRADGSRYGGVKAYWLDEAGQLTASKPKFRRLVLKLKKLACFGYVTEEMQADAFVAMDSFLTRMFSLEIAFRIGDAIFNGDGVAMPRGIAAHPAGVSVAKQAGQVAKSIVAQNIWNMWSRMWAPCRKNAVWLYNQDCEPQFYGMKLDIGTGGVPVFLPPGGIKDAPYASLMGRPMIPVEWAQTVGTVGDLVLWDPTSYIVLNKGTLETAMSMHFAFDTAQNAYRSIFRIDGDCWWNLPLTPKNGSQTLAPIITLATRA